MRLRATARSAQIDVNAFRDALARLAMRWRRLRISADGVELSGGTVSRGLRVEAGAHPWPGVGYRVSAPDQRVPKVTRADRAELEGHLKQRGDRDAIRREWARDSRERIGAHEPRVWFVELKADDTNRIDVHVRNAEDTQGAEVRLSHPARVDEIDVDFFSHNRGGGWLTRGRVTTQVTADLTQLGPHLRASLQVTVRHRHIRARGAVDVDASDPASWNSSLDAELRGHGLLRPVVALAAPLVRPLVSRQLRKFVRVFPTKIDEFNRQVEARFGTPPSPDRISEAILDDFLRELVDAP